MWRIVPLLSVLIGALRPAAQGRPLLYVNNTQQQYQADEHSNVTLTVSSPVNSPSDWLYIDLMRVRSWRSIYWYDWRGHTDSYTDDQFKGRLQCDPQLVGNGSMECLLSDVRLSDEGRYRWIVATKGRKNLTDLELVVRARKPDGETSHPDAEAEAVMPQTQEEPPKQTQRQRPGMWTSFGLFAVVILSLYLRKLFSPRLLLKKEDV